MSRHYKNCEICGRRVSKDEQTVPMEILDSEGYKVDVDACNDCQTKSGDEIFDFDEIVCSSCGNEASIINGVYDEVGWVQQEYGWLCPKDTPPPPVPAEEVTVSDVDRLTEALDKMVKELPPEEQYKIAVIRATEEYLNVLGVEEGVDEYSKAIASVALETLLDLIDVGGEE